jgi:hypothetical protein
MKLLLALALLLSLAMAAFAGPTLAAVDGCDLLNDPYLDTLSGVTEYSYNQHVYFRAGDVITIVSREDMTLYLPANTAVANFFSSGQYEYIVYQVPQTGSYDGIKVMTGGKDSDYWNFSCERAGSSAGQPCGAVLDGRFNNRPDLDCGAPVAGYAGDTLDIFAVNPQTGDGHLLYRLNPDLLTAGAANQTLWQGANPYNGTPVIVSLLATGELQINAFYADWKPYTIAWPADAPHNFYHIAW